MLADVLADLFARARGPRGELQHQGVDPGEIGVRGPARRAPRAEPSFERRDRVGGVLTSGDEVKRGAHERRFHDVTRIDPTGQLIALKVSEPSPERDVRGRRPLGLQARQALDHVHDAAALALE